MKALLTILLALIGCTEQTDDSALIEARQRMKSILAEETLPVPDPFATPVAPEPPPEPLPAAPELIRVTVYSDAACAPCIAMWAEVGQPNEFGISDYMGFRFIKAEKIPNNIRLIPHMVYSGGETTGWLDFENFKAEWEADQK